MPTDADVPIREHLEAILAKDLSALKESVADKVALLSAAINSQATITQVYLQGHRDTHAAQERALEIAQEESLHWRGAHNNWQAQTAKDRLELVDKSEWGRSHKEVCQKVDKLERLAGIIIGVSLILQLGFAALMVYLSHH